MTRRTLLNLDDWNSNRISNAAAAALNCYLSALRDQRGSGESSAPAEIESRIRIMDNVLRYLVVKNETK